MSSEPDHPDEATLERFVDGRLDPATAEAIRAHLVACQACRQLADGLQPEPTEPQFTPGTAVPTLPTDPLASGETRTFETAPWHEEVDYSSEIRFLRPAKDPASLGEIGEYEVRGVLGRGGMGLVLRAFDLTLQRTVAIKVLSAQLASSSKAHRRFLREARAAARINHPNVVTIHAVDKEGERPYLVMEYVHGQTLGQRIREAPPLDLVSIVRISTEIAAGLASAHQQGIVHRDIKPTNIMLEDGLERVKIADFGLACVTLDVSDLTSLEHVVGTPAYMSPEQVNGRVVDTRSDLFAFGCVIYAMAVGRSPFHGSHPMEVAHKIVSHVPELLDEVNPSISKSLADIVAALLEKDPNDRIQSAEEVLDLLQQHLMTLVQNQSPPAIKIPADGRKWRRRRRVAIGALVVGVMATVGAAVIMVRSCFREPAPVGTPELRDLARVAQSGQADSPPVREALGQVKPGGTIETPELRDLVMVAQSGQADSTTVREALGQVKPGGTIRVLDEATYPEEVVFETPAALRGVTLEALHQATLAPPAGAMSAIGVRDTPGVTVRGFQVRVGADQHAAVIRGDVAGLTLDRLTVIQPGDSQWCSLFFTAKARGTPDNPIRIRNSVFRSGLMSIVFEGSAEGPTSFARVENNRFDSSTGTHVLVNRAAEGIVIHGNVFVGGGVILTFTEPGLSRDIRVGNNTFLNTPHWLGVFRVDLVPDVVIYNNLVLGAEDLETQLPLARVAEQCSFRNNWWEPCATTDTEKACLVAGVKPKVDLLSRDPKSADFLRPAPGSLLFEAGAGGGFPKYVGAFPEHPGRQNE